MGSERSKNLGDTIRTEAHIENVARDLWHSAAGGTWRQNPNGNDAVRNRQIRSTVIGVCRRRERPRGLHAACCRVRFVRYSLHTRGNIEADRRNRFYWGWDLDDCVPMRSQMIHVP
jgi:hypothetical protein